MVPWLTPMGLSLIPVTYQMHSHFLHVQAMCKPTLNLSVKESVTLKWEVTIFIVKFPVEEATFLRWGEGGD